MNREEMAQKLRELRGEKTQAEIAAAIGVTMSAYAMYELAQRVPRDDVKVRISQYFKVPVQDIFFTADTHFKL